MIEVVKNSIQAAGVSAKAPGQDLKIKSVRMIFEAVATQAVGGSLAFKIPFIGMELKLGRKITKKDTHTIEIDLVPAPSEELRDSEIEQILVDAIDVIRSAVATAVEGDYPMQLEQGVITIAFAVTDAGSISLGLDGELSDELTHTLKLTLEAA